MFRRLVYTRRTLRIVTRVRQPSDIKSACMQMVAVRGWSKKNKAARARRAEMFVFPREMGDS